jgi:predicted TIM-barrel fold metal-dependent hydrolase
LLLAFSGVQDFEAVQALELGKLVNERLAGAQRLYPNRFAILAVVAPQDRESAAQEIERAVSSLMLRGGVINSHASGEYLDLPKDRPIFEALNAQKAPLYLHPREPSPIMIDSMPHYALEGPIWGYARTRFD